MISDRLTAIESDVETLRELVPQMLATQRQKVLDRFADMKAELDPQRLEQEMVMLAQKSDVAEELDRLSTHILEVRRVLKSGSCRATSGLPDARTESRGQYPGLQGIRSTQHPSGGQPQGVDRADA